MLEMIADDPWPGFGGLLACFAVSAWWFHRTQKKKAFLAAVGFLLLALAPIVISLLFDSPTKQVRRAVTDLARAAERHEPEAVIAALVPTYNFEGMTRDQLAELIRKEFGVFTADGVSITGLHVRVGGDRAVADLEATLSGRYAGEGMQVAVPRYFFRAMLTFQRAPVNWRIVEIHRLEPGSNPPREIPLTSR